MKLSPLIVLAVVFAPAPALAQVAFNVADLGTLGGNMCQANGVNNLGQVTGFSIDQPGNERAFLWTPAGTNGPSTNPQMQSLGTLGQTTSIGYGINNLGQVAGVSYTSSSIGSAFLWTPGGTGGPVTNPQMLSLGTLGGIGSTAVGVSDKGQVVGASSTLLPSGQPGPSRAFLWTPGGTNGVSTNPQMFSLGALSSSTANSLARGVNSAGQAVGVSDASGGVQHAFLYTNGAISDLGTIGGGVADSQANAINASGTIVGSSGSINGIRAFIDQGGAMNDLGFFGGSSSGFQALALDSSGDVVGGQDLYGTGSGHAFLYSGSVMHDLNAMIGPNTGWILVQATGINDREQIVGYGTIGGQTHAFILTPVPEPGTFSLAAVGALLTLACRRSHAKSLASPSPRI